MPTEVRMQAGALAPGERFHFEGMSEVFVKLSGQRYQSEKMPQVQILLDPGQAVIRIDHETSLESDLRFRNIPVGEEFFGILGHRMIKIANDGQYNVFNRTLCLRTTMGQGDLVYREIAADSAVSRMAERVNSAVERDAARLAAARKKSADEQQKALEKEHRGELKASGINSGDALLRELHRRVERLEARLGYKVRW